MNTLIEYYNNFLLLIKENPVLGGIVSLWGITVLTYCLRYIPSTYNFIVSQLTTSLTLNNSGWGMNTYQFTAFDKWFSEKSGWIKWSRNLSMSGNGISYNDDHTYVIGAGYGKHFFFYKGKLFWFYKTNLPSQGSEKEKESITINTFGRNQKPIFDLINQFAYKPKENEISIYTYNKESWDVLTPIKKRSLDSVILNKYTKYSIIDNVEYFFNNEEWYKKRGLNHKQTYVLHGKPGTGKTSIIKALASNYNKNICILNLASIPSAYLEKAISTLPSNSILLIEDFDSCEATIDREIKHENGDDKLSLGVPLSTILNTLDGVVSLNNTLIFMTTNYIDRIDKALLRKGRIDYIYEIKHLENDEIKEYIKLMYPDESIPNYKFKPILGCDIQALFLEHKEDYKEFISNLPKE